MFGSDEDDRGGVSDLEIKLSRKDLVKRNVGQDRMKDAFFSSVAEALHSSHVTSFRFGLIGPGATALGQMDAA